MRPSPITLLEGGLVFDRTGQTLIAAEPDAISIVELGAGGQTTRLPIRDARAVAAFADQLWIATHDDQLLRVDHAGRALAPHYSLPFAARAVLQPAPCGPAAAIWSSTPAVALIDDFGQLASTELRGVEIALPLTGRRFVTARGAKLTSPSGVVTMLAPNTTVLGGAVMSDGKSVTLLVAHGGGRQLIVVSLGSGQILRRCATPSSTIRLATRRSLAITLLEPRKIWIFDLHAGRELGTIGFDDDVDDFAIDPNGESLAVRCGNRSIELHQLVDLLRRPLVSVPAVSEAATPRATSEQRTARPESSEARTASPDSGGLDVDSSSCDPDAVSAVPADRFDVSDTDDTPTVNIRRPRSRAPSSPAEVGPRVDGEVDADVITSAARVDGLCPGDASNERRQFMSGSVGAVTSMSQVRTTGSPAGDACCDSPARAATVERCTRLACAPLTALDPRNRPPEIDRVAARDQLGRELRTVALWALGAIAAAWDSRKLGYGNEGKHPYELEVGAILGMNRGYADDYLAAARAQLFDHELAIAIDPRWRGIDTPVGALTDELKLDPIAVDILLVIAAAALWGEIARLYGILANDAARATVDELLVQQVLANRHDRHAVATALDPRGPLVRLGVVHIGARRARPFAELAVDPVVLDRLRAVAPDLGPATTIRTADRDLASLDIPADVLESAIAALSRHAPSPGGSSNAARIVVGGGWAAGVARYRARSLPGRVATSR